MYSLSLLLTSLALCLITGASPVPTSSITAAISRSAYKSAFSISTKDHDALSKVWTKGIQWDSSDLGQYGGKTSGFEQTVAAVRKSGENAKVSGLVKNLLVLDMITPNKARVNTYIARSRWEKHALRNLDKTFRICRRCADIWVLQGDTWKLQDSKVYNMGHGAEAPYYGSRD